MPCLSERPGSATQRCFVIGWKGSGGEEEDFGRIIIAIYVREDSDGVIERWTDRTTAQREGSRMVRGGSPGRCGRDEVTRQVCAKILGFHANRTITVPWACALWARRVGTYACFELLLRPFDMWEHRVYTVLMSRKKCQRCYLPLFVHRLHSSSLVA